MSGSRKGIFERLRGSKLFRRAYVRETVKQGIAHQIRAMRETRNMKQAELAAICGKSQSNIARWEDPDYGKYTLQTLLEVADAFDVFLSIQFVSFKEGLRRTDDKTSQALNARSFCDEDASWNVSSLIVFPDKDDIAVISRPYVSRAPSRERSLAGEYIGRSYRGTVL